MNKKISFPKPNHVTNLVNEGILSDNTFGCVKVFHELKNEDTESVWAKPMTGGFYRIQNLPFFTSDFGFKDVVLARPTGQTVSDGVQTISRYRFVSVVQQHSRYRSQAVIEKSVSEETKEHINTLCKLIHEDIHIEWATRSFFVLDIPSNTGIVSKVRSILRKQFGILLLDGYPITLEDVPKLDDEIEKDNILKRLRTRACIDLELN